MGYLVRMVTVIAVMGMMSGSAFAQGASNALPQALQQHDTDIKALLAGNETAIAAAIAALDAKVATNTALQRHQNSIKGLLDANTALIKALSTSVAKGTDIVRVAGAVAANKAALDALTTALRNHDSHVVTLASRVAELITTNEALLGAISSNVAGIQSDVGVIKRVVNDNNALLEGIAGSTGTVAPKIVFVTTEKWQGDFGVDIDPIVRVDSICQDAAESAELSGTYKAWFSLPDRYPGARFTKSTGPYIRTDGMLVALNYSDLTDGAIMSPITVTERGLVLDDVLNQYVWTNTTAYGQSGGADEDDNCANWRTKYSGRSAIAGYSPFVEGGWSQKVRLSCFGFGHLICVEQ